MLTMITYTCQHCGGAYQRQKGDASGKYCSRRCSTLAAKPSQSLIIPDGKPMSFRTQYRRKRAAGLTHPKIKAPFNECFFDEWSDSMAWLVGLIWSDGCLYGNAIEICSKDLQLLELVMALMEGGYYALKNQGRHIRVVFSSRYTCDRLRVIGLTPRKSLTVDWPIGIPAEYEGAFMRGLIDGDGSVLLRQTRVNQRAPDLNVQLVTASTNLRDGISLWCQKNTIQFSLGEQVHLDQPSWHSLWRFGVSQQEALRHLYLILYPSEDVACLHRKRIPFDVWMDTPRFPSGRIPSHLAEDRTDHNKAAADTRRLRKIDPKQTTFGGAI